MVVPRFSNAPRIGGYLFISTEISASNVPNIDNLEASVIAPLNIINQMEINCV